jgi:hypothetical protein
LNRELQRHLSPDARTRVLFYQRPDGAFGYSVEQFQIDDWPEDNYHDEYWETRTDRNAIFHSLEAAIKEAAVEFPWLRNRTRS